MKSQVNSRVLTTMHYQVQLASLASAGIALIVMAGWFFNIHILKSFTLTSPVMKFNTAMCVLFLSSALWLLQKEDTTPLQKVTGRVLAIIALLISLITLSEYLFGLDLRIDSFFIRDSEFTGRMSLVSVICIGLGGMALLLLDHKSSQYFPLSQFFVGLGGFIAYLFGFQTALQDLPFSLPASMAFIILAIGIAIARPTQGIIRMLTLNLPGSRVLRSLLPGIIIITVLMGWLTEELEKLGILNTGSESIFIVIALIWVYAPLLYLIARELNLSEEKYKLLFDSNPHPMWVYDQNTLAFLLVNDAAVTQYGYTHQEFQSMTIRDIRPPEEIPALLDNVKQQTAVMQRSTGWKHRKKDGTVFDVEIASHALEVDGHQARLVLSTDITEKQQAENQLRDSQKQYQALFEQSADPIFILALNGQHIDVNERAADILGYSREELLKLSYKDTTAEFTESENIRERLLAGQTISTYKRLFRKKDGTIFPVEPHISLIRDHLGQPLYIQSVVRDISEREQAEKALRESEARYRGIFDGVRDAIFVETVEGLILDVNQSACEMYGYRREEFIGKNVLEIVPSKESIVPLLEIEKEVFSRTKETINVRSNGGQFPVELSGNTVEFGDQKLFLVIVRDLTERKKIEAELHAVEKRSQALIENAPDGIVLVGPDGYIKFASPSAERIFGYTLQEIQQEDPSELTHPEDRERVVKELFAVMSDLTRVSTLQYRFLHKNGYWLWVESTFSNLMNVTSVQAIVINFQEITERKLTEERLRASEARFATMFHSTPNMIGISRLSDNKLINVNDSWGKVTGWSREETLGKTAFELNLWVNPPERERLKSLLLTGGTVSGFEMQMQTRSGSILSLLTSVEFITLDSEPCMLFTAQDITARKEVESELRSVLLNLEGAEQQAGLGSWYFDVHHKSGWWSQQMYRLFGMEPTDQAPSNEEYLAMIHPEDRGFLVDAMGKMSQGILPEKHEFRIFSQDGGVRILSSEYRLEEDKNGNAIRFLGTVLDITERKQVEEKLRESEQLYRGLAESFESGIAVVNSKGFFEYMNHVAATALGGDPHTLTGKHMSELFPPDEWEQQLNAIHEVIATKQGVVHEAQSTFADGTRWYRTSIQPLSDSSGKIDRALINLIDITESKKADVALKVSEENYRNLSESSESAIAVLDRKGKILYANSAGIHIWNDPHVVGKTIFDLYPREYAKRYLRTIRRVIDTREGTTDDVESLINGRSMWFSISMIPLKDADGSVNTLLLNAWDMTERKHAEEMLQANQRMLQLFVEYAPAAIAMFDRNMNYLAASRRYIADYRLPDENIVGRCHYDIFPEVPERWKSVHKRCLEGAIEMAEADPFLRQDGRVDWVRWEFRPWHQQNGEIGGIILFSEVITDRIQAEKEVKQHAEDLTLIKTLNDAANRNDSLETIMGAFTREARKTFECQDVAIYLLSPNGKELEMLNTTLPPHILNVIQKLIGIPIPKIRIPVREGSLTEQLLLHQQGTLLNTPETLQQWITEFAETQFLPEAARSSVKKFIPQIYKLLRIRSNLVVPLSSSERTIGLIEFSSRNGLSPKATERMAALSHQVTAILLRKQADEKLRASEERFRQLVNNIEEAFWMTDIETGREIYISPAMARIWGRSVEELMQNPQVFMENVLPEDKPALPSLLQKQARGESTDIEYRIQRSDGSIRWVWDRAFPIQDDKGKIRTVAGIAADITERKQAEEQIRLQLERLKSLTTIDSAISSSLNMRLTLRVILSELLSQLKVDSADILLLNPHLQLLEFTAGEGFFSTQWKDQSIRVGEGAAGRVALEQKKLYIPDLSKSEIVFIRHEQNKREGFVSYFGLPLVIKGKLKGVLEVFHRSPLQPDSEWQEFLNTLAGQTAIAIDNAQMFEGLQRSNLELTLAYDATIEGWSHALDLRDKETEGHSQRVTEMTLKLARRFGVSEQEQVQVRRGALLHDIGKLGVPDNILLKEGTLTDEEWTVMRKHPQYAYEMLFPITYLRFALDIPYCHHEKWDGSGYPRGLKGSEIPLAARIFAIVDVWDALSSDRPYRKGWEPERIMEHLREQSGKHFDPQVVLEFTRMLDEIRGTSS